MEKLVFFYTKGGTGKTTVCFNYGWYQAEKRGKRVLFLDFDPQMNLVKSFGDVPERAYEMTLERMLVRALKKEKVILSHYLFRAHPRIDVLPCSNNMSQMDDHLTDYLLHRQASERRHFQARHRNVILMRLLEEQIGPSPYDFILIDAPPSYSLLSATALLYARNLVLVVRPELYSLLDMNFLLRILDTLNEDFESDVRIVGALINGAEPEVDVSRRITDEFRARFGDSVPVLAQTVPLAEEVALSVTLRRSPVFLSYPQSPATADLLRAFAELDALIEADRPARSDRPGMESEPERRQE